LNDHGIYKNKFEKGTVVSTTIDMYNEKDKYGLMFSDYLFSEIRKMEVIEYINF